MIFNKFLKLVFMSLIIFPQVASAVNSGLITRVDFSGKDDPSHPNVVQLQIVGGFSSGACDNTYAAIRKEDSHLISFALAAYAAKIPITVYLNQNDIYFQPHLRCVIVFMHSN